jgi:hypothetical protein
MCNKKIFGKESTMTLENVLYTANAHTTGGRENGTARTDDGRLDIRLSPAAVSSILIFTASWKKWFCVTARDLDCLTPYALAFGWRGGATPGQGLADEVHMSA